ncbi:MAG: sugar transferase [Chlamydiales bacterium]|nr:sugar transferase [Chlamydiales bacterium]
MESKALSISLTRKRGFLKRVFDISFSLCLLLALFPVFLLIGLAIFICSPGPIFYTQIRLGRGGKPFKCYKFRTMRIDADEHLKKILQKDPLLSSEWERNQKLKIDPRIFPFGKYLRKTSLDELPQFWNVLKGDLSVVGPRPYMLKQRNELGPLAFKILSVRPGMTGLWQTSGRSNTTFNQRIALDAQYVDAYSMRFDCLLILKTIPEVLFPKNAF